ncbi:MAG: CoA-binding protein [Gemmatimonadaceae bacterium]|nr:CoA-binding protein [Gemmatimonadaceae bacterium]
MTTTTSPGRVLESDEDIGALLERTHRIAVLGIKIAETMQPAYYVPEYAQRSGYEIVPVPVYYPEVKEILGEAVYRKLVEVPGAIDMVNVFRRPKDLAMHLDDILAKRPRSAWLQLGIRDDTFASQLTAAGIDVVQDKCLLVELRRRGR